MPKHNRIPSAPVVIWDLVDEFLVECPHCERAAYVRPLRERTGARLACDACGSSRDREPEAAAAETFESAQPVAPDAKPGSPEAVDPYFGLPLWLKADCAGHVLWAYNVEHLLFLKRAFELVEPGAPPPERYRERHRVLASRMPKWMTRARNRSALATGTAELDRALARAKSASQERSIG